MKKKLFIFDWNGTLLNDTHANHAGFNETLKLFNLPARQLKHTATQWIFRWCMSIRATACRG